jgi:hypothetical protein
MMSRVAQTHLAGRVFETPDLGYKKLKTRNNCSKMTIKMSRDTLVDPLPPQCVIW